MKRVAVFLLTLTFVLCFAACGGGDDPVTAIRPGMTREEALKLEPDLTESGKNGMLHCKRSLGGTEGWLFVNFSTAKTGEIVQNVGWDAEPQENGEKVYRALLSGLKSCYGKPTDSAEVKTGGNSVRYTAIWSTETYLGKLTCTENTETGAARVSYLSGIE